MNADHIAALLEEHARVEDGRLANIPYLAVKLAEMAEAKHDFWRAGDPDCPRDIKAGNGELHTLRCKRCGLDSPRGQICSPASSKTTQVVAPE